ncbi:ADP/ATP carrier-like protein [Leishmania tarentolae]|uniref:ADP/ATP carrier-like protein n=1 Tax=Leishmania tarentolae TaxID=5689 RepID=A0A640KAM8_LEITA|nr:ADP/ATP carrier-like protein [Leishmania tarentolae]
MHLVRKPRQDKPCCRYHLRQGNGAAAKEAADALPLRDAGHALHGGCVPQPVLHNSDHHAMAHKVHRVKTQRCRAGYRQATHGLNDRRCPATALPIWRHVRSHEVQQGTLHRLVDNAAKMKRVSPR